jgi:hypothetical protein
MTNQTRRELLKLLAASTGAVGIAGTGVALGSQRSVDEDDDDDMVDDLIDDGIETARVRIGHLIPDAPPVDIYAFLPGNPDLGEVRLYEGLRFPTIVPELPAGYTDVPAIDVGLRITPADDPDTTVIEVPRLELEDDTNYTVLAVGELTAEDDEPEPEALVLVDNEDEDPPDYGLSQLPENDEVLVRFVHALPGAGAVSVKSGSETLAEGLTFGNATGYLEVDDCAPHMTADDATLATITGDLRRGTKYTIYVIDDTPDEDPTPNIQTTIDAVAKPTLRATPGGK